MKKYPISSFRVMKFRSFTLIIILERLSVAVKRKRRYLFCLFLVLRSGCLIVYYDAAVAIEVKAGKTVH